MTNWTRESLMELARNFRECRILLTGVELNLFTLVASSPLGAEEIVDRTGANPRALVILLNALTAMGLLMKEGGKYRCEPSASFLLSENSPDSVLPMIHHSKNLWERWSNLTKVVGGHCIKEQSQETCTRSFIGAMQVIAAPQAASIVAKVNPGSARQLLDVGGGPGTYTLAFLQAVPEMRATLFDRPEVIEIARAQMKEEGVANRVSLLSGDYLSDPLPPGHDLAFLSAIIHQHSLQQNSDLYRNVYRSLKAGGRIIVRDHVLEPHRTSPKAAALFAVNMLVGTEGGNCYTLHEIREGLMEAGFIRVALINPDTLMDGLVEAFKP